MPSERMLVRFDELCDIKRGASPRPIQDWMAPSGIPWVKISDATAAKSRFIDSTAEYIKEDGGRFSVAVHPGDFILSNSATPGLPKIMRISACIHDGWLLLRNFRRITKEYCYYLLLHERPKLVAQGNGSVFTNLKTDILKSHVVELPPLHEQVRVAETLLSLDDRIDLLRQTNATLESIAQALFKSWFIDFDPVRAKAEGREPEGMDAATAALFPAEFEESALGLIPKGWRVEPIGDLVDAVGGSTPDTKNAGFWEPAVHHWTSPKDLSGATAPVMLDTERKVSPAGLSRISSGLLPVGSLLMSSRAPIGYLTLTQVPVAINQGYIAMPPGGQLPPLYLYFWCQANMDGIKGRANGSTFMEISKRAFRPIPALLPPQQVIDRFVDFAGTLFNRLVANERQARALVELRDALLPRLISGKLRLPEGREQLESEGVTA